jgi:acyl-coenzyme A synthetase/AMP-(fatty) acid ligase/thioesterase domain-containing protein
LIGKLFERIAQRQPHALALQSKDCSLTYQQLSRAVDSTCHTLESIDGPTGLLFHHNPESVVAILAALKVGRLYVPLDPRAELEYLRLLVRSTKPRSLLCEKDTSATGQALHLPLATPSVDEPLPYEARDLDPDTLSSLLLTSGTTGLPKGVAESHRTLHQAAESLADCLELGTDSKIGHLTSYTFGASTLNVVATLLRGGTVCFYDLTLLGFKGLPDFIASHGITHLPLTPTGFRALMLQGAEGAFDSVRWLKLAGEPLTACDLELYRRHFPKTARISFVYGSSEAREICGLVLDHNSSFAADIPVGLARPGREVSVCDNGEIVVQSPYLTPGYWDGERPVRCSRFQGDRFFSGDLGRLDEQGRLYFCGRSDNQVKVGGHRVELLGVEQTLRQHPDVSDAVATIENGRLVAHLMVRGQPDLSSVTQRLQPRPELVFWEHLPMLSNGKVDRKALAARARAGGIPTDHLEASVLANCRKAFKQIPLGIDDKLSLDSLAAAELLTTLDRDFGCDLPLAVFADSPTVRELSQIVARYADTDRHWPISIELQSGSQPAFYCLPGAGYDPVVLLRLARLLNPDQPLRSFRPLGIHDPSPQPRCVEELASVYVEELLRQAGDEPILLGGSSFGGLVAFEMARQLQQRDRPPTCLVMFDTYGPHFPLPRPELSWTARILLRLIELLPISDRGEWSFLSVMRAIWFRIKLLLGRTPRAQSHAQRYHHLTVSQVEMARRYRPNEAFWGQALLVRTQSAFPSSFYQDDPTQGWKPLLPALELAEISGRHTEHLLSPNVEQLAPLVQEFLEQHR